MSAASVQILASKGCPNRDGAIELVDRAARQAGVEYELELIDVPDLEAATRLRFLGSPTIRVGDRDVEPGADARTDFSLSCRLYTTPTGPKGRPEEAWIRDALLGWLAA